MTLFIHERFTLKAYEGTTWSYPMIEIERIRELAANKGIYLKFVDC